MSWQKSVIEMLAQAEHQNKIIKTADAVAMAYLINFIYYQVLKFKFKGNI
jgi:hypothetical protein